jgi:hypothetical protein
LKGGGDVFPAAAHFFSLVGEKHQATVFLADDPAENPLSE